MVCGVENGPDHLKLMLSALETSIAVDLLLR